MILTGLHGALQAQSNPNYIHAFSPYRAVNTFHLCYKNWPVNAVYRKLFALFSELHKQLTLSGQNVELCNVKRGCTYSNQWDRPWDPPSHRVPGLSWGKVRSGRAADHSRLLVQPSWKSRAMPLHTLWATPGL